MRYAILADIHANLEALTAVLSAAQSLRADSIVCLGDIVGFYANPHECIGLVSTSVSACVRGNHDSVAAGLYEPDDFTESARHAIIWTKAGLIAEDATYLRALPLLDHVQGHFAIVHAALHPEPNDRVRIRTIDNARASLELMVSGAVAARICFAGHTHHPATYCLCNHSVTHMNVALLELTDEDHYLINPGSVGQPRDGDPRAAMAIYDTHRQIVEFHRVPYDRTATLAKATAAGLIPERHLLLRSASWLKHRVRASITHAAE